MRVMVLRIKRVVDMGNTRDEGGVSEARFVILVSYCGVPIGTFLPFFAASAAEMIAM